MITKRISILFILILSAGMALAGADNDTTKAIAKAVENLKTKKDNILPAVVPTADHLIKTYGIDLNIDKQKKTMIANAEGNDRVFLRFFDNDLKAPESQVKLMEGIDRITAAALYCDCYELPGDFFTEINDMGYRGGYSITHAMLALKIVEQRKCKYDTARFKKEIALLAPKLEELVVRKEPTSDMGIEAIVMLYISGNGNLVKPEWVTKMIAAQKPNGSWGDNDHTTLLALWALLEAERYVPAKTN